MAASSTRSDGKAIMIWKKRIPPGEQVGIKLTKAERALLLTGMVYMPEEAERAVRDTPASKPVRYPFTGRR